MRMYGMGEEELDEGVKLIRCRRIGVREMF
jgi:hypothetical protein